MEKVADFCQQYALPLITRVNHVATVTLLGSCKYKIPVHYKIVVYTIVHSLHTLSHTLL